MIEGLPSPVADAPPRVAIVIVTKDRAAILRQTLPKALDQDYPNLVVHVIDDASSDDTARMIRGEFPQVAFRRNEGPPLGYIILRSRAADWCADCKYLISLDDDSWLLQRDAVSRAVDFFRRHPDAALATFEIFSSWHQPLAPDPAADGREIAVFVGCGYAVDRERFDAVGRFSDFFEGYVEEADFALRIVDSPWKCRFAASVQVYHDETGMGRNRLKIVRNSLANSMLLYFIREPLWIAPFHAALVFLSGLAPAVRRGEAGYLIRGLAMFLARWRLIPRHRRVVRWASLRRYWKLHREWGAYFKRRLRDPGTRMRINRLEWRGP